MRPRKGKARFIEGDREVDRRVQHASVSEKSDLREFIHDTNDTSAKQSSEIPPGRKRSKKLSAAPRGRGSDTEELRGPGRYGPRLAVECLPRGQYSVEHSRCHRMFPWTWALRAACFTVLVARASAVFPNRTLYEVAVPAHSVPACGKARAVGPPPEISSWTLAVVSHFKGFCLCHLGTGPLLLHSRQLLSGWWWGGGGFLPPSLQGIALGLGGLG